MWARVFFFAVVAALVFAVFGFVLNRFKLIGVVAFQLALLLLSVNKVIRVVVSASRSCHKL